MTVSGTVCVCVLHGKKDCYQYFVKKHIFIVFHKGKSSFHCLSSLLCLLVNAWKYLTMMTMIFTELECKKLRTS